MSRDITTRFGTKVTFHPAGLSTVAEIQTNHGYVQLSLSEIIDIATAAGLLDDE